MALPALYEEDPFLVLDKDWYTEEEYFTLEDHSHARWEFLPDMSAPCGPRLGRIRAMSGGTLDHGAVAMSLGVALSGALRGAGIQTCRVFGSDVKVHTAAGRNTYPDVSVLCGKPVYHRGRRDIITNPILLAEVLSPSTQADDRSDKWSSYQSIPALQHYLLLSADRARLEVYTREPSGWHFDVWEASGASVPLPALGVTLALADIYAQVEFDLDLD